MTADLVHGGEAGRWGGWEWRAPRRGDHFRTCSYCGSIHPEDLAAEIIPQGKCLGCGAESLAAHYRMDMEESPGRPSHVYDPGAGYASWADQKYGWPHKFYVEGIRPRDPSLLHCYMHQTGDRQPEGRADWVAAADLTREQKKILVSDGMGPRGEDYSGWYAFRPRTALFAKFYTVHLADPRVPAAVKDKIETASRVRFHFPEEGRVRWHGVLVPCDQCPSPEVTGGSDGDQQVGSS